MTQQAQERATIPRPALIGIFGGLFTGYVGLTAVIPVLPGFVRTQLGAGDLAVGFAITGTALAALLTRPVAGRLADRHGHKQVMAVGALIVGGGAFLYLAPLGVVGLILVRLLLGIGEASLFTAGAVWTVSLAPRNRRGQLIGLYGVSMWGGISIGTLAGTTLQHFGYPPVWLLSAVVPLVGLVLISLVPDPRAAEPLAARPQAGPPDGRRLLGYSLVPRPVLLPGTALALAAAGYAGLASFVVLLLKSHGIGSGALVLTEFSAVYAGTRLFIGHFPDKLGPRRVAAWSGAGEAVGLLIVGTAPSLPVAFAGGLIMGVGFSLLYPSLSLMVMNRTDSARQGVALGAYTSFWDLGLGVWGPLTGLIATGLGYRAVFMVGAAAAAAAAAMALWIDRPGAPSQAATR